MNSTINIFELVLTKRFKKFFGLMTVLLMLFLPSFGFSNISGRIENETSLFLPWMIIIWIKTSAQYDTELVKIIPIWIVLILAIPTYLAIYEIYSYIYDDRMGDVAFWHIIKIFGYTVLQGFVYFCFLSRC